MPGRDDNYSRLVGQIASGSDKLNDAVVCAAGLTTVIVPKRAAQVAVITHLRMATKNAVSISVTLTDDNTVILTNNVSYDSPILVNFPLRLQSQAVNRPWKIVNNSTSHDVTAFVSAIYEPFADRPGWDG